MARPPGPRDADKAWRGIKPLIFYSGGEPPRGDRVVMVTAGERDSNRVTTRVWRRPRAIQSLRSRGPSTSAHVWCAWKGGSANRTVGKVISPPLVSDGTVGCSLTTSRLQRLARGILRTNGFDGVLRNFG